MTIRRLSSRTHRLDDSFLTEHLQNARSYKRIAGYFTSSLFEVAGELLHEIPDVRIVCNADIHPEDLKVAKLRETRMVGRWNERVPEADALLNRERYRRLDAFLQKHGQVIRVAPDNVCGFLHGKAGVIERADGSKVGFLGSINETKSGWQEHYEILWEDTSPEGVRWIEEEFEYLWRAARELPRAVMQEVHRRSHRREVQFEDLNEPEKLAPAVLIESPIYREGFALQPWQRGFLGECLRHYKNHGFVRLLLADEVGLGKTLSLGIAAVTLCLLQNQKKAARKPAVIFAPATLCEQWQTEMMDKLGIPSARWETRRKVWLSHDDRVISAEGREQIARCPLRIGIVSTGLMMRASLEKSYLLGLKPGLVILDEAHKARRLQILGRGESPPNELLTFMTEIAARSDHVLLGTATPVQTRSEDLWDLVRILHQGKGNFVLGHDMGSWHRPDEVLPVLSGKQIVDDPQAGWDLLRTPLPIVDSTAESRARKLFSAIRLDLRMPDTKHECSANLTDLSNETREDLIDELERPIAGASFFQRENPFVRHMVLRKRSDLEKEGWLDRVGVTLHPDRSRVKDRTHFDMLFEGRALRTQQEFKDAYEEAQNFSQALTKRREGKGTGFMKNLMQQRVCSSIEAGLCTARKLLSQYVFEGEAEENDDMEDVEAMLQNKSREEGAALQKLIDQVERVKKDPKLEAVIHYLEQEAWLEHGTIIFSQYYDTAKWIADSLAERYPDKAIGLYAGASRSRFYRQKDSNSIEREALKKMVAEREIRIMVATDAACEGLNLQTLGTLINIDLPWNPTRLEQRLGRIKRLGQSRSTVDMLNLVNEQTVDETVYERLSQRMQDRFDLFGSLPDTIEDDWIEDLEELDKNLDQYIEDHSKATGFDLQYRLTAEPSDEDWRKCTEVLSRRDFAELMSSGWS